MFRPSFFEACAMLFWTLWKCTGQREGTAATSIGFPQLICPVCTLLQFNSNQKTHIVKYKRKEGDSKINKLTKRNIYLSLWEEDQSSNYTTSSYFSVNSVFFFKKKKTNTHAIFAGIFLHLVPSKENFGKCPLLDYNFAQAIYEKGNFEGANAKTQIIYVKQNLGISTFHRSCSSNNQAFKNCKFMQKRR